MINSYLIFLQNADINWKQKFKKQRVKIIFFIATLKKINLVSWRMAENLIGLPCVNWNALGISLEALWPKS